MTQTTQRPPQTKRPKTKKPKAKKPKKKQQQRPKKVPPPPPPPPQQPTYVAITRPVPAPPQQRPRVQSTMSPATKNMIDMRKVISASARPPAPSGSSVGILDIFPDIVTTTTTRPFRFPQQENPRDGFTSRVRRVWVPILARFLQLLPGIIH